VQRLLEEDSGLLDDEGAAGWTPLVCAATKGHRDVVLCLLDLGADFDKPMPCDGGRTTPLLNACLLGHTSVVSLLVERGADPTISPDECLLPLMAASQSGHLDTVRYLLDHPIASATLNKRKGGATALFCAFAYGRGAIMRLLLERGADPTLPVYNGLTCKILSSSSYVPKGGSVEGRRECVKALEVRRSLLTL
jgi:uncharacterized protein